MLQFSNNKLLPRGDKSSDDKENQIQVRILCMYVCTVYVNVFFFWQNQSALMEQRNGDISPVWIPQSASRQDKVSYLADMKKLREQIQLIL